MAEKETGRAPRVPRATLTTPEEFTTASPHSAYPSGDYSYTVELVGSIQNALGKLTEAVDALKEQSKDHGKKIDEVRMDVHGAKAVFKTLLWVVGVVGTLLGIILSAYFRQLFSGSK